MVLAIGSALLALLVDKPPGVIRMVLILGVNGSPRKYGNVFKMLAAALKAAEREGAETELIHLYDYRIEPCLGCLCDDQLACRYPCVIEDDMRQLYDKILEADGLILATPIYWYAPSAVMKNFIDRMTVFENMILVEGRSWVEGKVAGIIAVGNDSGCIQVISTLMAALVSMGFVIPPWALAYYNRMGDVLEDDERLLDAANVGRVVARMARLLAGRRGEIWYEPKLAEWLKEAKEEIRRLAERNRRLQEAERAELVKKGLSIKPTPPSRRTP